MNFKPKITAIFEHDLKSIRRDFLLQRRLEKKMDEILENPYHYKPLRNALKNRRRTHIGSFVLIFEVVEKDKTVIFHAFQHHDEAYEESKK